ncbi:MAG: BtrH N-terminal domain-containing protein [Syntrophobacterales bacterium]|jgi:hypothetical protein|nr:BtrH N-terminal domain-containing protein [Syntrophobacterales bacterium]
MINILEKDFIHRQSAHCESGSTANLLFNHGINISEALAFGIGGGLFFGYFPFVKVQGFPLVTFRNAPGRIMKGTTRRLGIKIESARFKNPEKAMDALDAMLEKGTPVGLQAGVYWLPYFPDPLRFHFNAHTLVAVRQKDNGYLISDPVFDEPVVCSKEDLKKARFAEGVLAPKGKMYHISSIPDRFDLSGAARKGMKETCRMMIRTPIPHIGVRGIRLLAKRMKRWPKKYGSRKAKLHLGHVIRMQEEIGTGGGGFRLMYAAFLQESATILQENRLRDISARMTETGDRWREFAMYGARICKDRSADGDDYDLLSDILFDCADRESAIYGDLLKLVK